MTAVRLKSFEINAIKQEARIYLFGSRVDMTQKGGILIC